MSEEWRGAQREESVQGTGAAHTTHLADPGRVLREEKSTKVKGRGSHATHPVRAQRAAAVGGNAWRQTRGGELQGTATAGETLRADPEGRRETTKAGPGG